MRSKLWIMGLTMVLLLGGGTARAEEGHDDGGNLPEEALDAIEHECDTLREQLWNDGYLREEIEEQVRARRREMIEEHRHRHREHAERRRDRHGEGERGEMPFLIRAFAARLNHQGVPEEAIRERIEEIHWTWEAASEEERLDILEELIREVGAEVDDDLARHVLHHWKETGCNEEEARGHVRELRQMHRHVSDLRKLLIQSGAVEEGDRPATIGHIVGILNMPEEERRETIRNLLHAAVERHLGELETRLREGGKSEEEIARALDRARQEIMERIRREMRGDRGSRGDGGRGRGPHGHRGRPHRGEDHPDERENR